MFRVQINKAPAKMLNASTAIAISLVAGLTLGGCATSSKDHFTVGSVPDDYRTRHPIIVSESEVTEDIPISTNMKKLSFRGRNVVASFASRMVQSGSRNMQILAPSQSVNERAARRVTKDIVKILVEEGIPRQAIRITNYHAGGHSNSAPIRLISRELTADAGECGKWSDDMIADAENRQYENFGCATQNNLAKMIDNPADLLGPRGESSIDASRRDTIITTWRTEGSGDLPTLFDQ